MVRGGRGYVKWVDKGLKNGERMKNGGEERLWDCGGKWERNMGGRTTVRWEGKRWERLVKWIDKGRKNRERENEKWERREDVRW